MSPQCFSLDGSSPAERRRAFERVRELLLAGGLVALPTDTVWGVAALASKPAAVEALYALKGKDGRQAIPCLVAGRRQALRFFAPAPPLEALMERFWPGALTVVAPCRDGLLPAVRAGGDTLGLRMPDSPWLLELLETLPAPLAASSANPSGRPPLADGHAIEEELGGKLAAILDWNQVFSSCASTVLTWTEEGMKVLRAGDLLPRIEAHVRP